MEPCISLWPPATWGESLPAHAVLMHTLLLPCPGAWAPCRRLMCWGLVLAAGSGPPGAGWPAGRRPQGGSWVGWLPHVQAVVVTATVQSHCRRHPHACQRQCQRHCCGHSCSCCGAARTCGGCFEPFWPCDGLAKHRPVALWPGGSSQSPDPKLPATRAVRCPPCAACHPWLCSALRRPGTLH